MSVRKQIAPTCSVVADGLDFPEGPVAFEDGSVVLVEIGSGHVTRVDRAGGKHRLARLPGAPNGLALGPDGMLYCCNAGDTEFHLVDGRKEPKGTPSSYVSGSIWQVDPETGAARELFADCGGRPLRGPNDLVVDSSGGIYFTDLGKPVGDLRYFGGVYYIPPDLSGVRPVIYPFDFSNGIGLSPDGSVLYVAQTMAARLWAFEVEAPGQVRLLPDRWEKGILIGSLDGATGFDSLAVDPAGAICVATLNTGCISRFAPEGGLIDQLMFPDRYVTNICFSPNGAREAFVTLSSTGRLVRMDWNRAE